MKALRVLFSIVLLLSIVGMLAGCMVIPLYNTYQISPSTVSSIDFYDLRNNSRSGEQFLETEVPVYTLPENQIADFLNELSSIQFCDEVLITIAAIDPSFQYGSWVVRVNYNDGSYRLISNENYSTQFDKNNEFLSSNHYGCNKIVWLDFLSKYVPKGIFRYY